MALNVYSKSGGVYTAYSVNGDFSNPLTTVHHGRNGDTFETKLYLGSDDGSTYTSITLDAESTELDIGAGANPGTTGWGVKFMIDAGHTPTESEWDNTDYGNELGTWADDWVGESITSMATYLPFWMRIESPRNLDIKNKQNIKIVLKYTAT